MDRSRRWERETPQQSVKLIPGNGHPTATPREPFPPDAGHKPAECAPAPGSGWHLTSDRLLSVAQKSRSTNHPRARCSGGKIDHQATSQRSAITSGRRSVIILEFFGTGLLQITGSLIRVSGAIKNSVDTSSLRFTSHVPSARGEPRQGCCCRLPWKTAPADEEPVWPCCCCPPDDDPASRCQAVRRHRPINVTQTD